MYKRQLILVGTKFTGQSVSEFVRAQLRSSLIGGLGDLQALQNLNQLTELILGNCVNLTGQSVSESCSETTRALTDWWTQVNFNHFRI